MRRRQTGLGLVEALLALALGLMLLVAAGQVFVSAYQAWRLQGAAARLQDDARLALQRMAEDIRQAGMFGCLRLETEDFADPGAAQAFASPIEVTGDSLTLVGAELPGVLGSPDWTVLSDCRSWARVQPGQHVGDGELLALPVRRVTYRVHNGSLMLTSNAQHASLIDQVRALEVSRVEAGAGERLDIRLTLHDRQHGLEQHHSLSVALRNPGAGS
ncbi:pilus assembly protein PilW [Pseudomonas mosselii]|uniref:PilW family protein n=1 Tax=Pseudomonas mosselii TaxID=78327 RepID=UPI00244A2966|nr:pilus assembly protein PilW [Pseudomonas mosselii]MDH1657084.1 pilus assembly protein PilW [Pseudomonas mosselii]MDH1718524.1 pilus assembly protein PilW [Pseudomonas mosselii]MDH1723687.1 pilus assembly protein PilW [Pseudomonas mosselii]